MSQFMHRLTIHLKGGQSINIAFNAEKPEVLNPQIEMFLQTLGDHSKQEGNFLFQGARIILVRIADVSGAEVVRLMKKDDDNM